MSKISAVIITYNEEKNVGKCIDSVRPVSDEIIVIDSFSKDRTKAICEEKGVKVIEHQGKVPDQRWLGQPQNSSDLYGF